VWLLAALVALVFPEAGCLVAVAWRSTVVVPVLAVQITIHILENTVETVGGRA